MYLKGVKFIQILRSSKKGQRKGNLYHKRSENSMLAKLSKYGNIKAR
jgi:hypothetical protein